MSGLHASKGSREDARKKRGGMPKLRNPHRESKRRQLGKQGGEE